uniref:Uncharacterized protein n=1 Tax=Meloidogyne enterolobii TaxID=390850 RepID=A0A6V7U938_MELEN|nr:unnamed protein product [Meloidogyne enterolobii]
MASKQQQQPQTSIWLNNPLTNLFRRSGRKPKKEAKRENEENYVGIVSGDKKTKRSASCDTLHQSRLSTRFVDNQKQQRKTPELFINGNYRKENPFVPNKLYKTSKSEAQTQKARLPSKTRCTSKSQQNISRLIDTEEINVTNTTRHSRRDHSLGATPRISTNSQQIIRQVPINITEKYLNNFEENKNKFLLNTKTIKNSVSLTKIITTSTTTFICPITASKECQQQKENSEYSSNNSQQQKHQNYNDKSKEERNLALEKWMQTQPISIRKYEKHERIRLKITG